MKKLLLIFCSILFGLNITAQTEEKVYDALLKSHVSADGKIDYIGLRKNITVLDIYLDHLDKTIPLKNWSSNKAKAFWLNAYNAYTIKLIVESYPLRTIRDIKRKGKTAWEIPIAKVGKHAYTLDYIEHKILRRWHDDPRIHVGINACSLSGSKFPNYVFTEKNVDKKLDKLMKEFINDEEKNKITAGKLELSKVFEWYKEDFIAKGTIADYVSKYSDVKINDNAEVSFLEYDWSLNDRRKKSNVK